MFSGFIGRMYDREVLVFEYLSLKLNVEAAGRVKVPHSSKVPMFDVTL